MRAWEVFSQKATGDLGAEIIITSAKRIVKFREADESSAGSFSQKATGTLGMESIITSAKRNVKFREGDESSEGGFSQNSTGALGGEYHHCRRTECKIRRGG